MKKPESIQSNTDRLGQETVVRDGWVWPAKDDVAYDHIKMYAPLLRFAARQAEKHRVAIQAGGNAGMYPAILAGMFGKVYTFEPEPLNLQCLYENVPENVEVREGVLGNRNDLVGLVEREGVKPDGTSGVNTGAYTVFGEGVIPQYKIDDLDLGCLDFLQLDVEGYEFKALDGGKFTIDRFSPVVMIESYHHGEDAISFLTELGYRRLVKGVYDQVWVRSDAVDNV